MRKIMSFTLILCVLCLFTYSVSASSAKSQPIQKILIIVDDIDSFNISLVPEYEGAYDVVSSSQIKYNEISNYTAYAVSSRLIKTNKKLCKTLQNAYQKNNSMVYIYGELTIADYKQALNIDKFGANVDLYDKDGISIKKAFMSFGEEQENTSIENIISSSGSQSGEYIIANYKNEENIATDMDYISIILNNYGSISQGSTRSLTIVKSGYNFRTYYNTNNYLNMDYLLYKDNDESDPNYDYFALRSNLCTHNDSTLNTFSISEKQILPYSSDEMIDYGPGDLYRPSSISVGLDLASCSLGYSFDVGGGPTIDATYSAADDYCKWDIVRYWFYGGYLQNTLYCPGTSWASTGTYAGIDVSFSAIFENSGGFPFMTPTQTVQIRYDY